MVVTESTNWGDAVFDFERLLDFGVHASADASKSARQLACARCHSQKLRCVRQTSDARVCDRCLAANIKCVSRQPQRMGRPADTSNARRSGRPASTQRDRNSAQPASQLTRANKRPRNARISSPSPSPGDTGHNFSRATSQFQLDRWTWPSPPTANQTAAAPTGGVPTPRANSDSSSAGSTQPSSGLEFFPGSLGNFGSANTLLPSLEDLSNLFPGGIDAACFEPLWTPETSNVTTNGHSQVDDPVEHLSQLHLELYHCLVAVKSVERIKRDRLRCTSSEPAEEINTSWSENLFRTTERFIEALRDYIGSGKLAAPAGSLSATRASAEISNGREGNDADDLGPQIDTATGLMIVSCYTRLVQIFDVVVFVVETFRDMDCPGNYVQVQFGSFAPTANKALQARMLGQYVMYLLDGVSEAIDGALASRQPYARAVAEVRRNETKLKERILATLH